MQPQTRRATLHSLQRYLQQLQQLLDRAQAHDQAQGTALLQARLAPDMLPLAVQAEVVVNMALRVAFPLCGRAVPDLGRFATSYAGLRQRVQRAQHLLAPCAAALTAQPGEPGAAALPDLLSAEAGAASLQLPADAWVLQFGLPNFFFHLSMVYAILRAQGLPLGKRDFDGYHLYPAAGTGP